MGKLCDACETRHADSDSCPASIEELNIKITQLEEALREAIKWLYYTHKASRAFEIEQKIFGNKK